MFEHLDISRSNMKEEDIYNNHEALEEIDTTPR
jgi:hypothetical protein